MTSRNASVSIVCVYNDLAMRQECLDRSVETLAGEAADVEYLPIDNVSGHYPTAGSALNYGVLQARNDVVVFVHQDVFLHSLDALKQAAAQMVSGDYGLLGAIGVHRDGRIVGCIRDRVVLIGDSITTPAEVDSVDEVLFMAPRAQLLREPLTDSPELAWHGYAVEYGLRIRSAGRRVGVADVPLTHNSLRTNVAHLDVAHRALARRYSDMLPVRTTCGLVSPRTARPTNAKSWLASHRWRYRWLRESTAVWRTGVRSWRTLLADIRDDVDSVLDRSPGRLLYVINVSQDRRYTTVKSSKLQLARREGAVIISVNGISEIRSVLSRIPSGSWTLITNLSRTDTRMLDSYLSVPGILGYHTSIGFWLLLGMTSDQLPNRWQSRKATPWGARSYAESAGSTVTEYAVNSNHRT